MKRDRRREEGSEERERKKEAEETGRGEIEKRKGGRPIRVDNGKK